jgi:ribonuclease P protein component
MSQSDDNATSPQTPRLSYGLPHSHRLHGKRAFTAVFDGQMRKPAGPLLAWSIPNTLGHVRMGLSVSRRVGNAVKRNRIKRLLREAWRLTQHEWPAGYDVVLVVRPHETQKLADYQQMIRQIMVSTHAQWVKRRQKQADAQASQEAPTAQIPTPDTPGA